MCVRETEEGDKGCVFFLKTIRPLEFQKRKNTKEITVNVGHTQKWASGAGLFDR